MPLRNRNGKLEWRFQIAGHTYSEITDLADTPRNRDAAMRMEAEARRLVTLGRSTELVIRAELFIDAAEQFCAWADGEYRAHPNSAKRIRVSMTSAKVKFGTRSVQSITAGDIEDYKSWRLNQHKVKDVTLRHDLHALSLLFQYAQKHNWCRDNPVRQVAIPSDKDAVRDFVLTEEEEQRFFSTIDAMTAAARKHTKMVLGLRDVRDLSGLILQQGCRPDELRTLEQTLVDLGRGTLTIAKGKSDAARRILPVTEAGRFILAGRLGEPGRFVFPSRRGTGHIGQHQRLWNSIVKRAKLEGLVMYDLRHTFATRAVERGMALPELMAILGHSNLRSIMRYVHMKQKHIDAGMRTFEQGQAAGRFLSSFCPAESGKTGQNEASSGKSEKHLNGNKIN